MKWRFIKVDSKNLSYFFYPITQLRHEPRVNYITQCFSTMYNFGLFKLPENLGATKGKMFGSTILIDGYTCRVVFRRREDVDSLHIVQLDLSDFDDEEIEKYFLLCTVVPSRVGTYAS